MTKCGLRAGYRQRQRNGKCLRRNAPKSHALWFSSRFHAIRICHPGFYLAYLRGRSYCYHYSIIISNYIGKIIQPRRGQCTRSKYIPCLRTLYDKIVSQNAPDLHLSAYSFQKISPRELVAFGQSELLPQTINPR